MGRVFTSVVAQAVSSLRSLALLFEAGGLGQCLCECDGVALSVCLACVSQPFRLRIRARNELVFYLEFGKQTQ